jgi:hypothetical protein
MILTFLTNQQLACIPLIFAIAHRRDDDSFKVITYGGTITTKNSFVVQIFTKILPAEQVD